MACAESSAPTLVLPDGEVVHDSSKIVQRLAALFPGAQLQAATLRL
jgi:glutathione S-transferase